MVRRAEWLFCPRAQARTKLILEDPAVREVCFALRLMTGAKSAVRDRDNRAEELRLPPDVECLLQSVAEPDQLRLMQKSAVHEHASRPPIVANAYGQREVRKT